MKTRSIVLFLVVALLFAACMTPRQSEAAEVLRELYRQGILTNEQLQLLLDALNPSTWVNDVIAIGSGLFFGTGSYVATNWSRNRARRLRGEPVAAPKPETPA